MEAEDGYQNSYKSMNVKVVPWEGNWEKLKRLFTAYGRMCGVSEALKAGELKANEMANDKTETGAPYPWEEKEDEFNERVTEQSPRLAAMLTLSLINTVGVQQAILNDELENDEDGVRAWSLLIRQFELSTQDLKTDELYREWDDETLKPSEHPAILHSRLVSIQRKLARLNEQVTNKNLVRRFISAIERQRGHPYKEVISAYNNQMILGNPHTPEQLLEFLEVVYRQTKTNRSDEPPMKGLAMAKVSCKLCQYLCE